MSIVKLSVIIPCLNAEKTLPVQLEALAAQRWAEPWEIIIADNGSRDNSIQVASKFLGQFAGLRIIDASAKRSASYARNVGARAADADSLAFCDADDEVAPEWVSSMGEALQMHDVVYGQFRFDKFNEAARAEKVARKWKGGLFKGRFLKGGGTGNMGIKRWVHEAIGGFDESLPRFEDADYYWRLQLEGHELHYVPVAVVQVRIGRVNPSLGMLYRRKRDGAAANYWLYKRYRRFGMRPPPPLKDSLVTWLRHLKKLNDKGPNGKQRRDEWVNIFVQLNGRLLGELQGRVTNPCRPYKPSDKHLGTFNTGNGRLIP